MNLPEALQQARRFHGHLGPCVTIGLRLGYTALERLQARPYFGLKIHAFCPPQPPPSCCLDGLQISTGCTLGKRNIEWTASEEIKAHFLNVDTGQTLCLLLKPGLLEKAIGWMKNLGEEEASLKIWHLPEEELFDAITGFVTAPAM